MKTQRNPSRPDNPFQLLGQCASDIAGALRDPTPYEAGSCPYEDKDIGDVYSNFEHEFDLAVRRQLESGECCAGHVAWDFHGTVWFDGQTWFEQIRQHRKVVATLTAASLDDVVNQAIEKYGAD